MLERHFLLRMVVFCCVALDTSGVGVALGVAIGCAMGAVDAIIGFSTRK
jgi:hypothetical protein